MGSKVIVANCFREKTAHYLHDSDLVGSINLMGSGSLLVGCWLAAVQKEHLSAGDKPTLKGTADQQSPVNLHLFAHQPEEGSWFLMEQRIPHDTSERRYPGKPQSYPLFSFMAGDVQVELTIFPIDGMRHAPKSPVDGLPIKRADLEMVRRLLES